MGQHAHAQGAASTSKADWRRRVLRRLYSSNPFYVISADLVFIGLRMSFDASGRAIEAGALMTSLLGYTLLLATTACVLLRLGDVWDDVRTILLLVVAMFLAVSVSFDETLARSPRLGIPLYLGGLAFAVAVSEGVMRGIRLRLPAGFKGPYYLILALFFVYPIALSPLLLDPDDPRLHWALFGFSTVAALAFATLIPAIRRGPEYVADNGSPWRYPLYPWVLFGLLALAVCGRASYLCISFHFVGRSNSIFGPYFLVPFLLALDLLALEAGLVSKNRKTQRTAILLLPCIVAFAAFGGRPDPVYQGFLREFRRATHGTPVDLSLVAAAAFCLYASARRAPLALGGLSCALVALAIADPAAWASNDPTAVRPVPLIAASTLQIALALRRRESWRALLGAAGLVAVATLALHRPGWGWIQAAAAFHLTIAGFMLVGFFFDDEIARLVDQFAAMGLGIACVVASWAEPELLDRHHIPAAWATLYYPFATAGFLLAYGIVRKAPLYGVMGGLGLAGWAGGAGWRSYLALRRRIVGLDWIAWGLAFFAAAAAISLRKSGVLERGRRPAIAKDRGPSWPRLE